MPRLLNMTAYFRECHFDNWERVKDFVRRLGDGWLFRGQGAGGWPLSSSLERLDAPDKPDAEIGLLYEFQRKAIAHLQPHLVPKDVFGWLALMQHYGAPTRLLDWTRSPYIAFFFALERPMPPATEASLWVVDVNWIHDRVARMLNAQGKRSDEAERLIQQQQDALVEYFVRTNPFPGVAAVEPWVFDARQAAQQSVFLCPADVRKSFVENLAALQPLDFQRSVIRIGLSPLLRRAALDDLHRMNVTAATLFPGLDGFGRSLQTLRFDRDDHLQELFVALEGAAWTEAAVPLESAVEAFPSEDK